MTMGDEPTTTLTVAKLKALCVLNDVSASGKKAELLARLIEAGVDKETLGMEVFDESTATFLPASTDEASDSAEGDAKTEPAPTTEEPTPSDEPVMLSLEDEDTVSVPLPKASSKSDDEDVLEAEILEADLVDEGEPMATDAPAVPLPAATSDSTPLPEVKDKGQPMTLMAMVRRPQAVAVLLTLVLLGAGGWYYVNNQLEPFTADSLRYGDRMGYMITEGSFLASEEYVELVTDQLDDPPNYCKIRLSFQGESTASVLSLIHI